MRLTIRLPLLIFTARVPLIRIASRKIRGNLRAQGDRMPKSALVQTTVLLILLCSVAHA
jgi:hypothetical protein